MLSVQSLYENIEEGVIRGLVTSYYRGPDQIITQFKMLSGLLKDPLDKIKLIEKTLNDWVKKFSSMNIDLQDNEHNFLKKLDKLAYWKFAVILNTNFYKKSITDIIKNDVDKNKPIWIGFKDREIPMIYSIKTNKDIINILDIYKKRVNEVYQLSLKYPDKKKQFNKLLDFGLYGLIDLFTAIHSVVSYGSKGL